jgi:two-component system KDP operon response regulator KdpE
MKVLLIDDDAGIIDFITTIFKIGWPEAEIISAQSGRHGIELTASEDPSVVILDLGLPDISGFQVLEEIRCFSAVPVLILSVRGEEADIVRGLSLGADEYVQKPFRQLELLARVKALCRRDERVTEVHDLSFGKLSFSKSIRDIIYKKKSVIVTVTEGRILSRLVAARGDVVSSTELARAAWGNTKGTTMAENLKSYIYRLRQKLEEDPTHPTLILSKPGVGYFLANSDSSLGPD